MLQNLDFIVAYGLRNGENPVFQDLKRRTAYYGRSLKPQKTWFCGYETVTAEKVEIVRRLPNPVKNSRSLLKVLRMYTGNVLDRKK